MKFFRYHTNSCSCFILHFCYIFRSNAYLNEVANRRKNRSFFSPVMIGLCCLGGFFVCCGSLGAYFKCKDDYYARQRQNYARQREEINYRSGAGLQPLQGVTTTTNTSSVQREGASPPSHVTAPLLPEKPPISPLSNENGSELPPSYATAMAESS